MNTQHRILSIKFEDTDKLHQAYLPFINKGGIFIPTTDVFYLGEEIVIACQLVDELAIHTMNSKVIWINPQHELAATVAGIGVQFNDERSKSFCAKIDSYLLDYPTRDFKDFMI